MQNGTQPVSGPVPGPTGTVYVSRKYNPRSAFGRGESREVLAQRLRDEVGKAGVGRSYLGPKSKGRTSGTCINCMTSVIVRDPKEGLIHVTGYYACRPKATTSSVAA